MDEKKRLVIVVAGATGYVGRALCRSLAEGYHVIGLTRRSGPTPSIPGISWRSCDLFSTLECEQALQGADVGVYLVHSMIPSAHLTQGRFEDMDLILADNFARAARHNGLQRIIYLGGIVPDIAPERLSRHLRSRLEVEQTLGARDVPLTSLRASIVIGAFGSSFSIFRTLLARLPVIPCPRWSRSQTQPVGLEDLLTLFRYCLEHSVETIGTFDVGGADVVTYRGLLEQTARSMKLRRHFFDLPLRGAYFCKLWLRLITGTSMALVAPLVESMRFDMVARDSRLQAMAGVPGLDLDAVVATALEDERQLPIDPLSVVHPGEPEHYDVRSVQRLALPRGMNAREVVVRYLRWLPWLFRWVLRCEEDDQGGIQVVIRFLGWHVTLLELTHGRDRCPGDDRLVYFITGGLLVKPVNRPSRRPRIEFREMLNGTVVLLAIHNYRPTLPPWIYERTQALAHVWLTRRFGRYLQKIGQEKSENRGKSPV